MTWNVSPVAFTLHLGAIHWPVYWYGLLFASTFVYGVLIFRYLYRLEGRPPDDVYDLILAVIAGTLIGARLGHVLFYDPWFYLTHPVQILAIWKGGLASHGAVIGILIAVWWYARHKTDQSFLWICDRIGLAVPLSGCLIRIGNFFNSEILGRPADVPWAIVFARVDDVPRHPVQLYEALCYLLIFLTQLACYRSRSGKIPDGYLFGRFFVFVFGARFVLEAFKEHQAAFESGWGFSMGQWLSIPAFVAGLTLMRRSVEPAPERSRQERGIDSPHSPDRSRNIPPASTRSPPRSTAR